MNLLRERYPFLFKWYVIVIISAIIIIVLLTLFTDVFRGERYQHEPSVIWPLSGLILLIAVVIMLSKLMIMTDLLKNNGAKLDKIAEAMEKNRAVLTQIRKSSSISELAKGIAYRDNDMQTLREAVFDKLQQHDFESALKIIDQITYSTAYTKFAEELRNDVERYRHATDQERENQVIAHIEQLLDNYQWTEASVKIGRLIKAFPGSEKAKQMRQKLVDKKEDRKKTLLSSWDDAVKRQATNESLEILRELDMYLTPNEGLALQEAARDVFRTKLHNLGVQFSLAVSERQWDRALKTGHQIIRSFPNSRMAQEIREKIDVLREKAKQ